VDAANGSFIFKVFQEDAAIAFFRQQQGFGPKGIVSLAFLDEFEHRHTGVFTDALSLLNPQENVVNGTAETAEKAARFIGCPGCGGLY
jgi:hypothetical protein